MNEEELKKSEIIAKRIDVKNTTLRMFSGAIQALRNGKIEGASIDYDTSLIIITNFGMVFGEIEDIGGDPEGNETETKLNETLFKVRDDALARLEKEIGEEAYVANNYSVIVLKNASVRPFINPQISSNFQRLFLFADQIVGFTYGKCDV